MPARAKAEDTRILMNTELLGANIVTTRMPNAAASVVPAVDGETNRLRDRSCISMPATPMDMPTRIIARVRGTRLASMTRLAWRSSRLNSESSERL